MQERLPFKANCVSHSVSLGSFLLFAAACSSSDPDAVESPATATAGRPAIGSTGPNAGSPSAAIGSQTIAQAGSRTLLPTGGQAGLSSSIGGMAGGIPSLANGGAGPQNSSSTLASSVTAGNRSNPPPTPQAGRGALGGNTSVGGAVSNLRGGAPSTAGKSSVGGANLGGAASSATSTRSAAGTTAGRSEGNRPNGGSSHVTGGSSGLAGSNNAAAGTSVGTLSPILEPSSGALFGLYYGDASISTTTQKLGRSAPVHLTYYAWSDDWTSGETTSDLNAGRIPFVCWELFDITLAEISSGDQDALINKRAAAAKKLGKKLFVDFGAEMNGDWSPWSGAENGQSASAYIAAYRHVHDLFVAAGATNVIWTFCPNVVSVPDASWNEPLDYYPGDDYVDWMCVDGYNWGTSSSGDGWQSFYEVFRSIYPVLASKNKPIFIGEMASTEKGGDKAAWISEMIPTMQTKFPLIKGLNWFDVNKETDWRISSSATSETAFKQMVNDPWFMK